MTIYESTRNNRRGDTTSSRFRVDLPPPINDFEQHFFGSVSNTQYNFLRCDCSRGEQCFICNPVNTLQDLEQEFETHEVPNISVNIAEAIQQAMRGEEPCFPADLSVLPQFVAESELEECGVCFEKIKKSEKFRALPCSDTVYHKFHTACIDPWLQNHNTCPLCRREVSGCKQVLA